MSVLDSLPKAIEFGYCGVASTSRRSFVLSNPTLMSASFSFVTDPTCPFQITPSKGNFYFDQPPFL